MVQNKAKWILVLNFFLLSIFWKSTFGDYSTLERNCWKSVSVLVSKTFLVMLKKVHSTRQNTTSFYFNCFRLSPHVSPSVKNHIFGVSKW